MSTTSVAADTNVNSGSTTSSTRPELPPFPPEVVGGENESIGSFWEWAPRGKDMEFLPIPDADLPDKFRWRRNRDDPNIPDLSFGLFIPIHGVDINARADELGGKAHPGSLWPSHEIIINYVMSRLRRGAFIEPLVAPFSWANWAKSNGIKDPDMMLIVFYNNGDGPGLRAWYAGARRNVLVRVLKEAFGPKMPADAQPMWYLDCCAPWPRSVPASGNDATESLILL